ncbi:MAG: ribosome biogenesis GTP-binding protein YsxC [Bdellovibrionales bacterium]|nr:ribosome biogenesis GTP-binding protein YsxC [Bdellovibrionales bacterium]
MSKVEFILSATNKDHYPKTSLPEVALFGRSNSGKSSFVNAFFNRKKLAFVSNTPGKTQSINFFKAEDKYVLVDLPGYGFAQVSKKLIRNWSQMVEEYIAERESLVGALLIMDIRRDWSVDENLIFNWCVENGMPLVVLLNKSDKLSRSQQERRVEVLKAQSSPEIIFFRISALKRMGVQEVKEFIFKEWINA